MKEEVSWNAQAQKAIGLIPPFVSFNFLCSYIGLCLSFHDNHVVTFLSQKYLHLIFPFEEIELSQDDPLRSVHILATMPFNK